MAKKEIITEIEGRKVKLSNLDKVLFPSVTVSKAQLIQYYIQVAEYMLPLIKSRPLTLIRFPDGVHANKFYSKNRPSWTPSWVGSVQVYPEDDNIYSMANDTATLAWMANLATLEFHPMTIRAEHLTKPDHFIFDLDPSEQVSFQTIKDLAADLKGFLEGYGYYPFLKTSGGKGLHLYVPIKPLYDQPTVIDAVKSLAKDYVKQNPKTTLRMSKERRKGKILLDIFRNSKSQTCAAPYSTRGKVGCPVSTPLYWEELENLESSAQYNLLNVMDKLKSDGDPWKTYYDHAQPLHNQQGVKEDERLVKYDKKRDFKSTDEPSGEIPSVYVPQSRYVVQIHDASNLHYDLRLEEDGVLRSWAIPKGLPTRKGLKRLAIETEPHPIKYLTFEGTIPKGEYGGGEMWIFDSGQYSIAKKASKKLKFSLDGDLAGSYQLINTKGKQWLLERQDELEVIKDISTAPMLASAGKAIPSSKKYFYEIKWDGIRVIIEKNGKEVKIYSRSGNDITAKFPLIVAACLDIEAESIIADGEIVALDDTGIPSFSKTVGRMHLSGKLAIEKAAQRVTTAAYLFDCLYLDGKDLRDETIEIRRAWLKVNFKISENLRFSDTFEDGEALFEAVKAKRMEGIMCKLRGSKYTSDARSKSWLKIKVRGTDEAFIVGYTEGNGERSGIFGSLHLAKKDASGWKYKGRVGTGFTHEVLKAVKQQLDEAAVGPKLISESVDEESKTTWVNPMFVAEIKYASMTPNDTFREPVFVSIKKAPL